MRERKEPLRGILSKEDLIIGTEKFRESELLVDNLINLREEHEDAILTDSGILEKLVAKAMEESRAAGAPPKWEEELSG